MVSLCFKIKLNALSGLFGLFFLPEGYKYKIKQEKTAFVNGFIQLIKNFIKNKPQQRLKIAVYMNIWNQLHNKHTEKAHFILAAVIFQ